MATTGISGLSSGIDTTSLIASLISAASGPQTLLKNKLVKLNGQLSALQSLNSQAASLAATAKALTKPAAYAALAATSSSPATTAVVTGTPTSGSLTFDVTGLATAHSAIGPAVAAGTDTSGQVVLSVTRGADPNGAPGPSFTAASSSPTDLAAAINANDAALSATVVNSSDGSQRLVVSSRATGDASQFTLNGTATTVATTGRDAQITLADGSAVSSATNTFTGLMSGVDVTVTKLESGTTVGLATDASGVTKQVASLVSQLNALSGSIAVQTQSQPGAAGSAASSANNPLVGQSQVSALRTSLLSAVTSAVGGASAASAGIDVDRDGNVTLDQAKFAAYLTASPARAQVLVAGLAGQVATTATAASDPYSGTLSQMITGDKSQVTSLTTAIADYQTRLDQRQASLKAQFTAMETTLARLQTQSSALSAALSSLTSSSS